ncbi:unnamed protein product [Aphanomyces euteiches]|uniref:FYVE-type domain-containing protein n=1 Tax=Aphanomyces euteiches TaxID=100861 RepID=A0A6G0W6G9_9STRA|nr:hypothetical protein Ae201684_018501 [Aphanomyces euteiches]
MPVKVPLPPNYFKCPPLTREEIERFIEIGRQSTSALVKKAKLQGGTYDWKLLKDESELKIYKGHSHGTTEDSVLHCGVMEVVGQLDENMELYRDDTTEQAREYARRFGGAYVDVVNLYTVLPRHPDRPNDCMQIKWFLSKSPLDGLVTRRDFVMLETDLEFQVDGKRAWVRSYRSIELAAVPDMRKELGCIRGFMYDMGHVVIESDRRGYLHMTNLADLDIKGNVPSWANDQTLKSWLRAMTDIDRFMRENRLSRTPFLKKDELCPLDMRHHCALCRRKFSPLRKKSNCYKCGEVLCRACNRLWKVTINGHDAKVRACVTCSLSSSANYARKTSYSSHLGATPHRWTDILSNMTITEDRRTESDDVPTLDNDSDTESIDLSNYGDSTRGRAQDPDLMVMILDIPSMRESNQRLETTL